MEPFTLCSQQRYLPIWRRAVAGPCTLFQKSENQKKKPCKQTVPKPGNNSKYIIEKMRNGEQGIVNMEQQMWNSEQGTVNREQKIANMEQ